jgi:predicted ATPase/class 3 adenylate cyclase
MPSAWEPAEALQPGWSEGTGAEAQVRTRILDQRPLIATPLRHGPRSESLHVLTTDLWTVDATRRGTSVLNVRMARARETESFLFTDIEGSTALLKRIGSDLFDEVLTTHNRLIEESLATNGGREIGTQGDSSFSTFSTPSGCVTAAITIQRAMAAMNWPNQERIRVRMGVHCGEAIETTSGPVGISVHKAARIAAVANGGQIVASETAEALIKDADVAGLSMLDLGLHRLKDLGRAERLFQVNADGLDRHFPPLRSLNNPELEHNLPVQLTSFVGRERELAAVHTLVSQSRLVTLSGPGGSGKTRLALQVAADRLDGSADGVWLAELSPLSIEEQVHREVARVLGVREESGRPLVETLIESLHYRALLLILDNCEHVIEVCAGLAELIMKRCEHVWLLATSREPFAIAGERVYRVPPMSLPTGAVDELDPGELVSFEAIRLFVERAREHRPEFLLDAKNAPTVASLCGHLDGIPLALELAAARMRSMSLEAIERHLEQRFRLLSSRSRSGSARQQTMEGAVAWSYDLLSEQESFVLGALSVFPSSFDLPAAESVCATSLNIDPLAAADLVESLVDKSLVQTEQGDRDLRYRLLESIAQYAALRLVDASKDVIDRAQEAHALHYLAFTESAAPHLTHAEQMEWLTGISEEYENVRSALSYLVSHPGHGMESIRMVAALRVFWWANLGGSPGEARDLSTAALAHSEAQAATAERSGALLTLGVVEDGLGEADAARAAHEDGIAIAKAVGDARLIALHLCQLSFAWFRLGQYKEARDAANEALRMVDETEHPDAVALAHDRLTLADFAEKHFDSSRRHAAEAIRLYTSSGDNWRLSLTYNNVANNEVVAGDLVAARSCLESSLEKALLPQNRAYALSNLGLVCLLEGKPDDAGVLLHQCLRQLVRIGLFVIVPYVLIGLALCAGAAEELERAAMLHGAADSTIADQGRPYEPVEADLRERHVVKLRERMGAAFEEAYNRGRAMGRLEAVSFAMATDARQGT